MFLSKQAKIEAVQRKIKEHISDYIVDGRSGYFNESFLRQLLTYDINNMKSSPLESNSLSMLYFYIDNFSEINAKYSPEIGDETIINLGYLLSQSLTENDMLIKRNGPGFIYYITRQGKFNLSKFAQQLQLEIKRSQVFVEQISVSIASVSITEMDLSLDTDEIVRKMLSAGNKRVNIVPTLGPNAYLDTDIIKKNHTFGKILLITANHLTLKMFDMFFQESGIEVLHAVDPYQGIDIAYEQTVDAIICDQTMPKMDGFALKMKLNDNSFTMNTLFILLSNLKTVESIHRANELRMDYVVSRPIIYEEVLGFIQREIKKRGTRL